MNTVKDFGKFDTSFQQKKKYIKLKPTTFFFIIGLVIILLGVSFFLYASKTNTVSQQSEQSLSEEEIQILTESVSGLMIIPKEEPVVFVISDVQELIKQQQFFKDAINGDILLIFPEAAKAVVYSPSRNIIVNTGPVTADNSQIQDQQQPVRSESSNESILQTESGSEQEIIE